MVSGNGRRAEAWTWDEAPCGVVPPLISQLISSGQADAHAMAAVVSHVLAGGRARLSMRVRRHADLLAR